MTLDNSPPIQVVYVRYCTNPQLAMKSQKQQLRQGSGYLRFFNKTMYLPSPNKLEEKEVFNFESSTVT